MKEMHVDKDILTDYKVPWFYYLELLTWSMYAMYADF